MHLYVNVAVKFDVVSMGALQAPAVVARVRLGTVAPGVGGGYTRWWWVYQMWVLVRLAGVNVI